MKHSYIFLLSGFLMLSISLKAQQPFNIGERISQIYTHAEGIGFVNLFKTNKESFSCKGYSLAYCQEFTLEKLTEDYKWEVLGKVTTIDNDSIWSIGGLTYYRDEFFVVANTSRHGHGLFKIKNNRLLLVKNWPKVMSKCTKKMGCDDGVRCTGVPTNMSLSMGRMYFNAPSYFDDKSSSAGRYEYQLHESDGTFDGTKKAEVSKDDARLQSPYFVGDNYLLLPKTHGLGNPTYFLQVITPNGSFRIYGSGIVDYKTTFFKSRTDPFVFYIKGERAIHKVDVLKQEKTVAFDFLDEFGGLQRIAIMGDDKLFFEGVSNVTNKVVWGICDLTGRRERAYINVNPDAFTSRGVGVLGDNVLVHYSQHDSSGIVEIDQVGNKKFHPAQNVHQYLQTSFINIAGVPFIYGNGSELTTFREGDPKLLHKELTLTWFIREGKGIPNVFHNRNPDTRKYEHYVFEHSPKRATKGFRTIRVFKDDNFNGVWDKGESGIGNLKVKMGNEVLFTDRFGRVFMRFDEFEKEDVKIAVEYDKSTWDVHSSTSSEITLKKETLLESTTHFVALGNLKNHNVKVQLKESRSRCRSPKTITAEIFNATPRNVKASILISIDTLNKIDSFPEYYEQINDTVFKASITIKGGGTHRSRFYTTVHDSVGLPILNELVVESEFFDGVIINQKSRKASEVRCSFDPNDKSSEPNGIWKEEFLLKSDTNKLEYMIQFQNYGNDTAYDVKILDQLSSHLDWNSFEFLGSSHYTVVSINDGGELKFDFQDIMLPDTGVNMAGSMGYARYSIKPKSDLGHRTTITNKASIYFDFNDPVVTNTTKDIWVHDMPVDAPQFTSVTLKDDITIQLDYKAEDPFTREVEIHRSINDTLNYSLVSSETNTSIQWLDKSPREDATFYYKLRAINGVEKSGWSETKSLIYKKSGIHNPRLQDIIKIYPNPAQNQLNVQINAGQPGQLILLDMSGKQILQQTVSGNMVLDVSHLPKGPYMLKVSVDGNQMEKMISLQ